MCTGAEILIASTAITAISSAASAGFAVTAANAENEMRQYQLDIQNKQLAADQKLAEAQATQVEADRRAESRRLRATNEAFMAGSGIGESYSFLQGADKAADRALRTDVANLRLNLATTTSRIADQIAVNRAQAQYGDFATRLTAASKYTNAFFDTASAAAGNYYKYTTLRS